MRLFGKSSLGRNLVMAIMMTSLLALGLSLILNLLMFFHTFRVNTVQKAGGFAGLVSASSVAALDFSDPEAALQNLEQIKMVQDIVGGTIYTNDGKIFAQYGVSPSVLLDESNPSDIRMNGFTLWQPIGDPHDPSGYLLIEGIFAGQREWYARNIPMSLAVVAILFVACIFVAMNFKRRLTRPLRALTDMVESITRHKDYSNRVSYESHDEVGILISQFNAMLDEVQKRDQWLTSHREILEIMVANRTRQLRVKQDELRKRNRQLRVQIAERKKAEMIRDEVERINRHDLKSSLNLVIGYPELLLSGDNLSNRQRRHIKRIEAAGYRMLDMIKNHLDMFKMEKGIYALKRESVDIIELLCSLEEELSLLLKRENVTLDMLLDGRFVTGEENFCVRGDISLMRTMLRNLVKNAIEASCSGDVVTITVDSCQASLGIHNTCAVSESVRHRFFAKYVTEGKEGGTGLGTYSAMLIAKTHKATLSMKTDDEEGTTVSLTFRS